MNERTWNETFLLSFTEIIGSFCDKRSMINFLINAFHPL